MASEFEFFHGAVFARILHVTQREISLMPYSDEDNAAYVIDGDKGIYIKYSTKRMSPWRFSFQRRHHEKIAEMKRDLREMFVILVCNDDGTVVLTFEEYQEVRKQGDEPGDWISAARNRRQMYLVKGPEGRLAFKIGKDDFAGKIFAAREHRPRLRVLFE